MLFRSKKDVIVRGGHKIYPARIEALAMRHAAVARAAAVPVRDVRLGEKVCLAVHYCGGERLAPDTLLAHLDAGGLSPYDMPEFILELDAMPVTASGKIRKHAIVDLIERGDLRPAPVRWQRKRQASR